MSATIHDINRLWSTLSRVNQSVTEVAVQGYPRELVSSAVFLLKKLGMKVTAQSSRAYEDAGLHPYHYAILALLDEGVRETQGAIAQALGYDKGQLVGLLDELEAAGLVERRRDPVDRRRHVVAMTTRGEEALETLRTIAGTVEQDFLAPLSEDERRQLHALLLKVAQEHLPNCQKILAAASL